jgi:hypothetical protein
MAVWGKVSGAAAGLFVGGPRSIGQASAKPSPVRP